MDYDDMSNNQLCLLLIEAQPEVSYEGSSYCAGFGSKQGGREQAALKPCLDEELPFDPSWRRAALLYERPCSQRVNLPHAS